MNTFKYDVVTLIKLVKQHPCLWNKSLDEFKDRAARKQAWVEVFVSLEPTYHELPDEEQRLIAEPILNKWTNIRDAFIKSVRHRAGRNRNKKYIFHNHLTFLIPDQAEDSNWSVNMDSRYSEIELDSEDTPTRVEKRIRKRKIGEEEPKKVFMHKGDTSFTEIDEYHDPRVMNEDEAFFASLLPSVVNYSEEERLEFRIGVLGLMKRIKHGSKWESDD